MESRGEATGSTVEMAAQTTVDDAALLLDDNLVCFFVDAKNSVQKIVLKTEVAGQSRVFRAKKKSIIDIDMTPFVSLNSWIVGLPGEQ